MCSDMSLVPDINIVFTEGGCKLLVIYDADNMYSSDAKPYKQMMFYKKSAKIEKVDGRPRDIQ